MAFVNCTARLVLVRSLWLEVDIRRLSFREGNSSRLWINPKARAPTSAMTDLCLYWVFIVILELRS